VLVSAVAHDTVVEIADLVAPALENLDEQVLAEAQDAGDPELGVARPGLLEDESCTEWSAGVVARLA